MKAHREIEHKFLVKKDKLPGLSPYVRQRITQGYISRKPVVRVRIIRGCDALLTIKGKGSRCRDEFEMPIERDAAKGLMQLCKFKIKKIRYFMENGWVLDRFLGPLKGLWLAEIELESEYSKLPPLPRWIGRDVTFSPKFTNASLAERRRPPRA